MAGEISVLYAFLFTYWYCYHFIIGILNQVCSKDFLRVMGATLFTPLSKPLNVENVHYVAIYSGWDIEACLNYRVSGNSGIFSSVSY